MDANEWQVQVVFFQSAHIGVDRLIEPMPNFVPRAICLLSGGLDSATCLALARRDGFDIYALSIGAYWR